MRMSCELQHASRAKATYRPCANKKLRTDLCQIVQKMKGILNEGVNKPALRAQPASNGNGREMGEGRREEKGAKTALLSCS